MINYKILEEFKVEDRPEIAQKLISGEYKFQWVNPSDRWMSTIYAPYEYDYIDNCFSNGFHISTGNLLSPLLKNTNRSRQWLFCVDDHTAISEYKIDFVILVPILTTSYSIYELF